MKHAQRTEKYIRLIFNSYISDDDFLQKSMSIIYTNYFFSGDFQGQEGVRIMHQCALCNPKYGIYLYIYFIYIRLKIKPNSVRIRFQSCQIFVLPSTGFEPTPLIHCSTIRLALRLAPQTTRPHPLPKKGASIIVVLPFVVRQIQGYT